MLKEKIGILIFMLGVSMADSEWMIVPIAVTALGMWLARGLMTSEEGENNGND